MPGLRALACLAVPAALFAGCSGSDGDHRGGVQGTVTVGPMCPVERDPPDPDCADQPLATHLAAMSEDGQRTFLEFDSDSQGRFFIKLEPGPYVIRSAGPNMYPYCQSEPFTVVEKLLGAVHVDCDSGIR